MYKKRKIQGPIRVLHLIEHLKVGGAERVVVDLVQALNRNRIHSLICLYRERGKLASELESSGYPILFLRKEIITPHIPGFLRLPFILLESIIFVFRLAELIRKNRILIVHSHMTSANLWGKLAVLVGRHSGIITTIHNIRDHQNSIKKDIIFRILLPLSDRVVAVSQKVAETIKQNQSSIRNKLIVIPNGIRVCNYKEVGNTNHNGQQENLPGTKPLIAIIGRLVKQKRHDLFLKSIRICMDRIPQINCWIIGDGPEKCRLEQLAQKLNLADKVFFLGERNDVRTLLHLVNVIVNTSDREGLPISLLEAMAEGVPVVAVDAGGNGEIVKTGKTGILVKTGDINGIANGICQILENPDLGKQLGLTGQARVSEFYSLDKTTKMWEKLYKDVLEGDSPVCG
jgi:glycosyltransferase involved in cell wall biosynthesis